MKKYKNSKYPPELDGRLNRSKTIFAIEPNLKGSLGLHHSQTFAIIHNNRYVEIKYVASAWHTTGQSWAMTEADRVDLIKFPHIIDNHRMFEN